MIQKKNSNAKPAKVLTESQKELSTLKDAYGKMMDKYGTVYGSENYIKNIQELAKKYKLPIICPSTDPKGIPSFTLNGCFERFKSADRWTLFTKSYRNTPMFYERDYRWGLEPNYEWYLGQDHQWYFKQNYITCLQLNCKWYLKQKHRWYLAQEKDVEEFFHEDFLKKDTQIISGANPSVFKKDVRGDRVEIGKQISFDIFGRGRSAFYDRNEFIEGICEKKRTGRNDVRDFLKKHLLPIDEFDLKLYDFLRSPARTPTPLSGPSFDSSIDNIHLIIEKFHSAIQNIGIKLIKCDGKDCLWYEDYAIIPNISIDLSEIGYTEPYYLPMCFFFYHDFYPMIEYKNYSVIWQYIFLQQSGLVRSAQRMHNSQKKIPFFKYFYNIVRPSYYYPIFQVGEGGTIKLIANIPLCADAGDIINLREIWDDISKNNMEQLPEDAENIYWLIKYLS